MNPFDYFTHTFEPNKVRLVMTLLVKNESDIIQTNIRTHAQLGVDAFVVMDNGSTDGTREILSQLQHEFAITIIDEPSHNFQQKRWMTSLAEMAKKTYRPDWVINNDADEFWIPKQGKTLKEILNFKGGVVRVNRSNMLPTASSRDDEMDFIHAQWQVCNQVAYRQSSPEMPTLMFGQASRKVITNPHGLIKINAGNHSAEHIAYWKKCATDDVHVYHYPIRSYAQLYKRAVTRKKMLESSGRTTAGSQYKDLVAQLETGSLKSEYEKYLFNQEELTAFQRIGIIVHNPLPARIIKL